MSIQRIQSVYVAVSDMARAQAFYEQVLAQPAKFRDAERWCQFAVGAGAFALSSAQEAADGASGAVVVFGSDDLPAVAERVAAAGGRALALRDMGGHGRVQTFADPDGNLFQVHARPAHLP
jgi:predicted enzyme related to lactoylglutathione lyase